MNAIVMRNRPAGARGMYGGFPSIISDGFSQDNGWLDGNLAAAAMTIAGGRGIWTPTYSANLLVNPGGPFVFTVPDTPDGWTVSGESGTDPEVSEVGSGEAHGGAGTGSINSYNTATATQPRYQQTGLFAVNDWLLSQVVVSYVTGTFMTNGFAPQYATSPGTYIATGRTNINIWQHANIGTNGDATIDSSSIKKVTLATMFRLRRVYYSSLVQTLIRCTNYTHKGVVLFKDSNNFILATMDTSGANRRAVLLKRVAGTWSANISNPTITYAAGAALKLTPNAAFTTFAVSYNGVEVIAPQAIADFSFSSGPWYAGLFNAYNSTNIDADAFDDFLAQRVVA